MAEAKWLFTKYSEHLEEFKKASGMSLVSRDSKTEQKEPLIACPLSFQFFTEAEACNPSIMSKEHNPPRRYAKNRTPLILTKTSFNNYFGTKTDLVARRVLETEDFRNANVGAKTRVTVILPDTHVEVHFVRGENEQLWIEYPKGISLEREAELERVLKSDSTEQLVFPPIYVSDAYRGYIKIAHLEMFRRFGYYYLFSPSGRMVRERIFNGIPEEDSYGLVDVSEEVRDEGIYFVVINKTHCAYAVVFNMKVKTQKQVACLMPGHGPVAFAQYKAIITKGFKASKSDFYFVEGDRLPHGHIHPMEYRENWIQLMHFYNSIGAKGYFSPIPVPHPPRFGFH